MGYEIYGETFLDSGFDEPVLYAPARTDGFVKCTRLNIITAFTDTERISTYMIALSEGMKNKRFLKGIKVDITVGMTKSSLSMKKHENICRLIHFLRTSKGMPDITCRYVCSGQEVHSKLYIWGTPDGFFDRAGYLPYLPVIGYCGSLNFTMNAFYKRRETVSLCDPMKALTYWKELLPDTIDCLDPLAESKLKNIVNKNAEAAEEPDISEPDYATYDGQKPVDVCRVSLLFADGSGTGYGSGVNWGIRPNGYKRDPNQAYIPYNVQDRIPGFFPDRVNPDDKNCPMFRVITKDFGSFHMRMAQQGNKALQSVESNAILGEWIRKEINAPSGGFITKKMLELHGKTYVTFRKYLDEDGQPVYLLDF